MTIHLAYLLPSSMRSWREKARSLLKGPPRVQDVTWPTPTGSPFSITRHLGSFLAQYDSVRLYDWTHKKALDLEPNDIFIFHPLPISSEMQNPESEWTSIDPMSVGALTLAANPNCRAVMIVPFNSETACGWLTSTLRENTVRVITICDSFWQTSWDASPYGQLCGGYLRIPMGIEPVDFPNIRCSFNPPGQRSFLYIGHTAYTKNTAQLEKICEAWPDFRGGHLGHGEIRGMKKLSIHRDLTDDYMRSIASQFDFVLSTSRLDAQATTILEAISWGFPVACTPETGFSGPEFVELTTDNTDFNVRTLQTLNVENEHVLHQHLTALRKRLKSDHSWELIGESVAKFLELN